MRGVSYSLAALVLCEPVVSLLSTTGSTVELNSIDYFLPPQPVATINLGKFSSNGTIVPMMVVESGSDVSATIQSYDTKDDVFQKAFAEGERLAFFLPRLAIGLLDMPAVRMRRDT